MKKNYSLLYGALVLCLIVWGACGGKGSSTGPSDSGLELSGAITQSGSAFAGVDVYLSWGASSKTTTGSDGKFAFKSLVSGSYFITPAKLGIAFTPSNFEVSPTRKDLNFAGSTATYGTEVNSIAKDFSAKDQNNASVSLSSYHGKVVLLDFTADWCVPCREKAETAEAFYQKYKDKGFMYLLVVIEGSPSVWASTYSLTFPVLNDNSQVIYNQYRKGSIPLPHVMDRNLVIRYKKEGWNKSEVEDLITKLL